MVTPGEERQTFQRKRARGDHHDPAHEEHIPAAEGTEQSLDPPPALPPSANHSAPVAHSVSESMLGSPTEGLLLGATGIPAAAVPLWDLKLKDQRAGPDKLPDKPRAMCHGA